MTSYLDKLLNLLFLVIGIIIGLYLNKDKIKGTIQEYQDRIKTILIKPQGTIGNSKEENSLNKITDEVNYHHNDFYDEQG